MTSTLTLIFSCYLIDISAIDHTYDNKSRVYTNHIVFRMVENTQSKNFKWKVEVDDVFEVEREGEKERFRPFQKLPHHRLLWHGSR
jgi:hypothetical protein